VNETTENIGARRLHTIMEKVLDEISFAAPDMMKVAAGASPVTASDAEKPLPVLVERAIDREGVAGVERVLRVEREYVQQQVADIVKNQDLSRYIL